jgi:hypothetical protein
MPLAESHPHEIAFGVAGRFSAGKTVWEQIDAASFATFASAAERPRLRAHRGP